LCTKTIPFNHIMVLGLMEKSGTYARLSPQ
jgi:hypothetical protein